MTKIGLVLSGGMAKGAYQVGVLRAIENNFPKSDITCISAASIGVLNAYAYATDNLNIAEKMWKEASKDRNKYIASLINSGFLKQSIHTLSEYETVSASKFYLPLYNLRRNQLHYVDLQKTPGQLREKYLSAAVAMPVFNEAVQIEKNNYYDGAVIDNIPIKPLYAEPLDYIICVYFDNCNYIFEDKYLDQRVLKIVFYNSQRIRQSLRVDEESVELMIREGYDKSSRFFDFLFANGNDDLEVIYQRKSKLEQKFLLSEKRITGDVVVNNFNRIAKKMVRSKNAIQN